MRLIERLELRNAEGCYDRVVLVEDLVDGAGNVPVREIDDHVLITAAFGVGLPSGTARHIAADWAALLQFAIWPVDPQFTLQDERPVGRTMPMQRDPLVRRKLEQQVDDPCVLVDA